MISTEIAAILSLRAYDKYVQDQNLPAVPSGWTELPKRLPETHGFGYSLYRSGEGEIIIAYRGTDAVMGWDGLTDIGLFLGFATSQALQAAKVYVRTVQEYGPNVTFTGHSLGGGLASMMALWFGRPAVVFDSAPSEAAATRMDVIQWARDKLGASTPPNLSSFDPVADLVTRESQITSHYAVGEFLKELSLRSATTGLYALPEVPLDFGTGQIGMFALHSQALLTAGLLVPEFAAAASRVQAALPLIMAGGYYSPDVSGLRSRNFVLDLIRSEQASAGAGKLTHFAADLNKLGTDLSGLSASAQDALIAQAIEWYYWQGAGYAGQEFFTPAGGALQYATAQGDGLPGALNKADSYARLWLNPSSSLRTAAVPAFGQWNVATSASGAVAAARDPGKSQIFVGAAGADQFTGGAVDDLMLGGAGHDTYVVGSGRDRVQDDLSGEGRLLTQSGDVLSGGRANGKRGQWVGARQEIYSFSPTQSGGLGTLTISGLGAGNEVKIERFDYAQATSHSGFLGIKLDSGPRVALVRGGTPNFWSDSGASLADLAGKQAAVSEGGASIFTVALSADAKAGESIALNLLGLGGKQVKLVNGATTVDAEGAVLQLVEGQTELSFALVHDGTLDADATGTFSVTYQAHDGTATSNEWSLTLQDTGVTTRTFLGDQHPRVVGDRYQWSETEWAVDGTLVNGVYEANFADVLYATNGNDKVDGRGGNDAVGAGAGHDEVDGGPGDDLLGGGSGSDVIRGGDGNDFISSGGNTVAPVQEYTTQNWRAPAGALVKAQGSTWGVYTLNGSTYWAGMGGMLIESVGDTVDAGPGDDGVIGSWGDDRVEGGPGNDMLDGLAGGDVIEGGLGNDYLQGDGSVESRSLNTVPAANHGADFVDGGDGADVILGGGQSDELFGGAGNDQMFGDASGPTGSLAYVPVAYHGSDYLDGEDGDDYLEGSGGEDTLYGGAQNDTLWGDTAAANVAAQHNAALWAADYLDGEDGDDVLIGGGRDDQLFGGVGDDTLWGDERSTALAPEYHGEDYLDGEDGADFLEGGGNDDTLFGGTGNDTLWGDATPAALAGTAHGSDSLDGEDGDDGIVGNGGADVLLGGAGNDILLGDSNGGDLAAAYHGDDYLDGGDGNDLLLGDGGADLLEGGLGDDQLQGGEDDDQLSGGEGVDILFGEAGNDSLQGGAGNDQLVGGLGDDVLDGGEGLNKLFGQEGNDTLIGGAAADQFQGGAGDDMLIGGGGDDVYYYWYGDGQDRIVDAGGRDWLVFTDASTSEIVVTLGSLKIVLPDGGAVHLDDFDPEHPMDGSIELFQFTDGVFTREQLIEMLGFDVQGTPEDDTLRGTALGERITALDGADAVAASGGNDTIDLGGGGDIADAGDGNDTVLAGSGADYVQGGPGADVIDGASDDDVLYGGPGNDVIAGGSGDDILGGEAGVDLLQGGDGDDMYAFGLGDGDDTVVDAAGANWVQLGAGVGASQVRLSRAGDDLLLAIAGTADRLTLKDWFSDPAAPWTLGLDDGTTWNRAAIEERVLRNQAPVLGPDEAFAREDMLTQVSGNLLANDADPDGRPLRITTPGTAAGSYGTVSIDADGFFTYALDNASPSVQSLGHEQAGADTFTYTATDDDPAGAANASSTLTVTVFGTNDLPALGADSAAAWEDDSLPATGNVLANDGDVDAGTQLRVTAPGTYAGTYGALELSADGAFAYDVANAAAQVQALGRFQQGTERFGFSVTDGLASVAAALTVTVNGRNDAPVVAVPLPDQTAATSGNTSYSWQVPAGSFTDVDAGDTLSYAATLADGSPLPSWLAFDAASRTFSGRVPRTATGFIDIQVVATDRAGASTDLTGSLAAADVFRLTFGASSGGGGGGGGGGGTKGNEGVGNGEDPPPPGHDTNFNDGPGAAPGDPGARGGRWLPADAPAAAQVTLRRPDEHAAPIAIEVAQARAVPGSSDEATAVPAEDAGKPGNRNGQLRSAPSEAAAAHAAQEPQPPLAGGAGALPSQDAAADATNAHGAGRRPDAVGLAAPATGSGVAAPRANTFMPAWTAMDERLLAHLAEGVDGTGEAMDAEFWPGRGFHLGSAAWSGELSKFGANGSLAVLGGLREGLRQATL